MTLRRKTSTRKTPRRSLAFAAFLVCLACLVLTACGDDDEPASPPPDYEKALAGAPPELAAIYKRGNELIPGGKSAYERQIEELRGYPIVVNVWASWCGPCRAEFPHFQQVSAKLGKEVAFLGVDSDDAEDAAATFLRDHPVPYPSFLDPDKKISVELVTPYYLPATIFYDRRGNRYLRHGVYTSEEELIADIRKHALGGGA